MKQQPPMLLRSSPLLSNGCAIREGGHRQRTQAKRRIRGLAALARRSLAWIARVSRTAPSLDARVFRQEA